MGLCLLMLLTGMNKLYSQQLHLTDSLDVLHNEETPKTKPFHFITNVPSDIAHIATAPFQRSNLKGLLITLGATALLLPFDQAITDGIKNVSDRMHFHSETDYKILIRYKDTKVFKVPRNLNSALYQLGEGGTSIILAGGLLLYGKIGHHRRDVSTASDLVETFITMGITTQVIKRITGRQSPFMATQAGGVWHPFPSFKNYQENTSNFDAFPSGHLATMSATVYTLIFNYPEKKWIKPVGFTLIGLTGLAMINTDVHWISDYPLAIALGYISARITNKKNHPIIYKPAEGVRF